MRFQLETSGVENAHLSYLKISLVGLFDLDESEEDEDDLLQRTGNFISTSTSLPKGILKVRVSEVGPPQLITSEIHMLPSYNGMDSFYLWD